MEGFVWLSPVEAGGEEEARVRRRTQADCDRLVEMVQEERRPRQSPQIDGERQCRTDKKVQTPQKPKKGKGKRLKSIP